MWKCSKCKKEFSIFKPSSVVNNLCVECFTKSFKFAGMESKLILQELGDSNENT